MVGTKTIGPLWVDALRHQRVAAPRRAAVFTADYLAAEAGAAVLVTGALAGAGAFINCFSMALGADEDFTCSIEIVSVKRKKREPSQTVNLVSTVVVCAPNRLSVRPPPKAAPRPSLLGRCIRMVRIISRQTITRKDTRIGMISHIAA